MKYVNTLPIVILLLMTLPAEAQTRNAPGRSRRNAAVQGHLKVEVVTIPEDVAAKFVRLMPKALLYRLVEKKADKVPLIISLHGSGGGNRDMETKKWMGEARRLLKPENNKYEAMLLVPQSERGWDPDSLGKMLDYILRSNPEIDKKRIYCMGYSMGGKGTWTWAMHSPNRFAAIMPMAFIPDLSEIESMVDLPIWAMVGDRDSRPRIQGIPAMEKRLKELGSTKVRTTVFAGANHASASRLTQDEEGVYEWLFSHSRNSVRK